MAVTVITEQIVTQCWKNTFLYKNNSEENAHILQLEFQIVFMDGPYSNEVKYSIY